MQMNIEKHEKTINLSVRRNIHPFVAAVNQLTQHVKKSFHLQ